jgi:hypothetical protein
MPASHRQAVRLTRAADQELARASQLWRSLVEHTIPVWKAAIASHLAPVLMVTGVTASVLVKAGVFDPGLAHTTVLGLFWLPLGPALYWASYSAWHSVPAGPMARVTAAFAARPGLTFGCRSCGAPLGAPGPEALFVRCIYCKTDSLVQLDAGHTRALAGKAVQAAANAEHALSMLRLRASSFDRNRTGCAAFAVLLLLIVVLFTFVSQGWAILLILAMAGAAVLAFLLMADFHVVRGQGLTLEDGISGEAARAMGMGWVVFAIAMTLIMMIMTGVLVME